MVYSPTGSHHIPEGLQYGQTVELTKCLIDVKTKFNLREFAMGYTQGPQGTKEKGS